MFTGIITEIGKVKSLSRRGGSYRLEINCKGTKDEVSIGDSVAVNGTCLSVVERNEPLTFDVVSNTLNNTNLKRLTSGSKVNLENALKVGDDLSGHMVSGHIDIERKVKRNQKTKDGWVLEVEVLREDEKHLVDKGSVAIDGVSLTVAEVKRGYFKVFLIPHTLGETTLESKKSGDYVNIEFDMMGKYAQKKEEKSNITSTFLKEKGFM